MRRGGSMVQKVDLDGYEEKEARQERQVLANAVRSIKDPSRGTMEWSR